MTRATLIALAVAMSSLGSARAQDPAEPKPEMTTYYFGMLLKGDGWTAAGADSPERIELQKQHIAHLQSMHKAGRLMIAGPLLDDGTIRGLLVYKAASLDEARAWAEADPAVKAGRLKVEMHPWMVQKGILKEPEAPAATAK